MSKKFNPSQMFSLSGVKRAAAEIQSSITAPGHSELSMAMYSEKCMAEAMEKVISTKTEANDSWVKWAEQEDQGAIREMCLKMAELDTMWLAVHNDYADIYNTHRKIYKQVLKGEQSIDELQKQYDEIGVKIKKAQKQVESAAKSKDKKLSQYDADLANHITQANSLQKQLETRKLNHAVFKYGKIRDAQKPVFNFQLQLHEKCLEIAKARRAVLELYTGHNYYKMTPDMVLNASVEATNLINDVSAKLQEISDAGETGNRTSQQPRYAEAPLPPNSEWSEACYMGIPPSKDQQDVFQPKGYDQRPLPDLPAKRQSTKPASQSPGEELYEYIAPSDVPSRQGTQSDEYISPSQDSLYDNNNPYLPMSRPTSTVSTAEPTEGLPPPPPELMPGYSTRQQEGMYPKLPDDPHYDLAGNQGAGSKPLSSYYPDAQQ